MTIDEAFAYMEQQKREGRYHFGHQSDGRPLSQDAKRFMVEMYQGATGDILLPDPLWNRAGDVLPRLENEGCSRSVLVWYCPGRTYPPTGYRIKELTVCNKMPFWGGDFILPDDLWMELPSPGKQP